MKVRAKIENWSVIGIGKDPYRSPEQSTLVIVGFVSGHPKFEDGSRIHTSAVTMISYRNKVAVTLNTIYELGSPDPEFLEWLTQSGLFIEDYEAGRMDN